MRRDGQDPRIEANAALYALLSRAEGCGTAARSARLAQDDELAEFLCRGRSSMRPAVFLRSARQSRSHTEDEETDLKYEQFAERAGRRLEAVADRLEGDAGRLGINGEASKTTARAQELRVAALLIRDEATAVGREEREPPTQEVAANPPLEAQG